MTETNYRVPIGAYHGGHGYRFVAGPPAQFPYNDFSKTDEGGWIVFEISTGPDWSGEAMGQKLVSILDKFINQEKRETTRKAEKRECEHGISFAINGQGKHLFTIYPNDSHHERSWTGEELADTIASLI